MMGSSNRLVIGLCLFLGACATQPSKILVPVAASVPGASRVDMLVATTRKPASDPGELFTGERATAISLTNIVVSVPPDSNRKVGEIQWPGRSPGNPETDFVTLKVAPVLSTNAAMDWYRRNRGSKRRLLVFVHGFNNTYSDAVYRFAQISHDAGIDASPVLFTWPSRASVFDYVYDKESTNFSRHALEELLLGATRSPDVGEVTILAHSMGSWLVTEALRDIALRDKGISAKIRNVVLASPDIDLDVFRRQIIEMGSKRPHFTIFSSRNDRALALSRWLSGDVERVGAADMRPYAAALAALGISIIDTSDVKAGDPLAHNTFADSPEMVRVLGQRLSGQSLAGGEASLTEQVGMAALGGARIAGAAVTAPVAAMSQASRRQLIQRFGAGGTPGARTLDY
ncbi:alpha/beta hydrolase [Bosea sp. 685]|uniref:alpha/beta hydrolase n=1 Tax=Bosea sp. 685 TaxID=3080057 RepID=UPI002892B737|nr:alpha/beta hydrolase [Bosea sp. 685]WNJ92401.1 alpha/beta hydrolase [Bosea sp. 685]